MSPNPFILLKIRKVKCLTQVYRIKKLLLAKEALGSLSSTLTSDQLNIFFICWKLGRKYDPALLN